MVDPTRALSAAAVNLGAIAGLQGAGTDQTAPAGRSFKAILAQSIAEVNRLQDDADTAILRLQTGKEVDLTHVMVAVEKADLAFKALMQVRNKLVEAYKQIEQMRV